MTREQAFELLELEPEANSQEIRQAYKNIYNELQIRLTNAPTEQQKNLYSNRIKKIDDAYLLLLGNVEEDYEYLPNIGPVEEEKQEIKNKKMDEENALSILGISPDYSEKELYDAYGEKQQQFETAIQNAPFEKARILLKEGMEELDEAFELLLKNVIKKGLKSNTKTEKKHQTIEKTVPTPSKASTSQTFHPKEKKKSKSPLIIGVLTAIILLLVAFKYGYDEYQKTKYEKELSGMVTEAESLMNEEDYKAAYLKYLEIGAFCKEDCDKYILAAEEAGKKSMAVHEALLNEAETLLQNYEFDKAKEKLIAANNWHTSEWELEESLQIVEEARKEHESLQEEERLRRQQQLLEEQAERERRERQLASANEMEASGDVYFRNAEYQKAYDFFQKSLDFYYSDRVWRKRNEAEKKMPINILLTFSQVDSRMGNFKDNSKEFRTENGVLKGFSFDEAFSYNKYFNIPRITDASYIEISLDIRHVSGADNHPFGLNFLSKESNPGNRFGISVSNNASTHIGTFDGKWNTIWESNSNIKKGSGVWNTLKIIYQSGRVTYFVNGVQVKQEQVKILGNTIGIYQSGNIKEAWYDNLSIKATF
ncbi:hypothetical protein [Lunatimonas salinarum]|uniref:hypothetical protein n=1 Tax=Lunatimonas salinarum TaxID=1774590 RepID=UPI001AE0700A|nr:hypothetical protein [Lunatimonas salinarum]